MKAADLDALLVHAKERDESLLFILFDGWELVLELLPNCPVMPHFLDDGDDILDDMGDDAFVVHDVDGLATGEAPR